MIRRIREWLVNFRAVVLAIAVHVAVAGILLVNLEWTEPKKPVSNAPKAPMQVTTIDKAVVDEELAKIDLAEKKKEAEHQQKLKEEQRKLAEIEKKRKAEEQRLTDIKRKKEEEKKKVAEEKRKQELAAKKERERKQAEQKEKERKARELAEKKKKEAAEKARQRKLAEEKKRKAAEVKRQQELAAQKQREQELQAAMAAEAAMSRVEALTAQIREHVTNNWYIPATARQGMRCELLVRLFPTGEVQTVQVVSSSGDASFDKSVEDAIYRASPLPVPKPSEGLFHKHFREFKFNFNPRNLKG